MPISSAILLAMLLASPAPTVQLDSPPPAHGKLTIVGTDTVDFGRRRPGTHRRSLLIRNDGADTLRQITVHSGCSCVSGAAERTWLAPGDTMSIHLVAAATDREEEWERRIILTSTDPVSPSIPVIVKMTLKPDVVLLTDVNSVIRERCANDSCTWKIVLKNVGNTPVMITPPFIEEQRGIAVMFSSGEPVRVAPGDSVTFSGAVGIVGGEQLPSARALIRTSSSFSSEIRLGYYYLAQQSAGK